MKNPALGPATFIHRQARTGCDSHDLDVASGRQRVGRVDEIGQIVARVALSGDGTGVQERLPAVGRRRDAEAAEVLVVEDHVVAVRPDQVGVVRVDAIGDDPDFDAGPVDDLVGGVRVHHLARLGLDQRHGRIARADLLVGRRAGPAVMRRAGRAEKRPSPTRQRRRSAASRRGRRRSTAGVGLQPAASAAEIVAAIALMMWKLACGWREPGAVRSGYPPGRHRPPGSARSGCHPWREARQLVLKDDDRTLVRVRRQFGDLRCGEHRLGALEHAVR